MGSHFENSYLFPSFVTPVTIVAYTEPWITYIGIHGTAIEWNVRNMNDEHKVQYTVTLIQEKF